MSLSDDEFDDACEVDETLRMYVAEEDDVTNRDEVFLHSARRPLAEVGRFVRNQGNLFTFTDDLGIPLLLLVTKNSLELRLTRAVICTWEAASPD